MSENKIKDESEYSKLDQWLHGWMDKHMWLAIFAVITVGLVCTAVLVVIAPLDVDESMIVGEDDLSSRLGDAGWVLFTTSQCPYCDDQKDLLGSVDGLSVVECDSSKGASNICMAYNVTTVPTWYNLRSDDVVVGLQTVEDLELMINE